MVELPTSEQLSKVSSRAMAAYAARCVRRVQPLYRPIKDDPHPLELNRPRAVDFALDLAEQFAAGLEIAPDAIKAAADASAALGSDRGSFLHSEVAKAAAAVCALAVSSIASTLAAYGANLACDVAADDATDAAALADYFRILELDHEIKQDACTSLDPKPEGPLGPLWPEGEPDWYREATEKQEALWNVAALV